jgi:hypothetical protein
MRWALQEAVIEKCSPGAGAALEPAVVLSRRASEVDNLWKSLAYGQKGNQLAKVDGEFSVGDSIVRFPDVEFVSFGDHLHFALGSVVERFIQSQQC